MWEGVAVLKWQCNEELWENEQCGDMIIWSRNPTRPNECGLVQFLRWYQFRHSLKSMICVHLNSTEPSEVSTFADSFTGIMRLTSKIGLCLCVWYIKSGIWQIFRESSKWGDILISRRKFPFKQTTFSLIILYLIHLIAQMVNGLVYRRKLSIR